MSAPLHIIAAVSPNGGIGINNQLPWHLKYFYDFVIFREEFGHFTRVTSLTHDKNKRNAVIMGRNTWESLPENHRPLKNRINVILSNTLQEPPPGADFVAQSLQEALDKLSIEPYSDEVETIYAIGGEGVYKDALLNDRFTRMYLTRIMKDYDCDRFFPNFNPEDFTLGKCDKCPEIYLYGVREDDTDWKLEIYDKLKAY